MKFTVEISPGELLDRYTILDIKRVKIGDSAKKRIVMKELSQLAKLRSELYDEAREQGKAARLEALETDLATINQELWIVEDEIRLCEVEQEFHNDRFIHLARSVYKTNDRRAVTKRLISQLMDAEVYEVKNHV